jgi:hypothetical protein
LSGSNRLVAARKMIPHAHAIAVVVDAFEELRRARAPAY